MTLDDESGAARPRAKSLENRTRPIAIKIATPFQQRIAPWQMQLARLRTRPGTEAAREAAILLPQIIAARIELEGALVDLNNPEVSAHSAVLSIRASLSRLREAMESFSTASETKK